MQIFSSHFKHNQEFPHLYTCDGKNVSPPLSWTKIPAQAQSLALIVDDPDAPRKTFVHWIMWNIPANSLGIPESIPQQGELPDGTMQGVSDFGNVGYGGPCPPSGTHRYFFKLYALDKILDLNGGAKKSDLEEAMQGHVIAHAEMIGLYKRVK